MRFAYADPPYFGCGKSLYGKHHPEAAIWDDEKTHVELAEKVVAEYPDGWVMSLNPRDLKMYLNALPDDVRIGSWVKTFHQIRPTTTQFAWEAVLFMGGRKDNKRSPMVRDWFQGNATRMRGLPGVKSHEFNRWVLDLLNYQEGDTVDDLFPGMGGMEKCVNEMVML